MAETAQERQENELEALKAIFGAQLISTNECRTLDGSTWSPLECVLSLGPQQGSCGPQESQAFINIQIVCSEDYPEKAPQLFVQESKGLSTVQISQLQNDLKQLTEENRGEVVVYEVAHYIMTYLHRYSRPGFESFYDEMLARKRLQQQREAERRRAVESKKRQEMILEIQSKQEAMRLENNKRRKNSFIESDSDDESQNLRRKSESPVKKTVPITVEPIHSKETKAKEDAVENKSDSKDEEDFCPWTFNSKGNSRIESEFLVLKWLGEGAFGDVIKARNKLDGCLYAIKRIKLSSTTNVLYRKITREVKLLSRLNHENVVRYFNSWIESASDSTENSSECSPKSEESKMVEMLPKKELTLEWSVGNEGVADGSSDDSSDDECWITFMPGVDDSSSSIAEESKSSDKAKQPSNGDCDSTCGRETEDGGTREKTDETSTNITPLHFMYIQMEFCEKSTLRNAIDEGLYLEEARVWRLLREIVEGLSHIHGQGIIHRDLKPVNIFIDCDDHVKIGDFGLATSNIFHSALKPPGEQGLLVGLAKNPVNSSSAQMGTALTSHTGQVGTALYVAPELNTFGVKASYDQKVDIYSLGVIFFEMCYHPVSTAMERLKILTDLRQPDCIFPSDFLEDKKPEQAHVIRWLLNHDACRRPSSQELLLSPLIPPPQLEDAQLQEMVRHTLSNPQSRAYKHLIAACFSQELSPAQDVTFDMSPTTVRGPVYSAQIEAVSESVRQVMRQHGAIYLPMPLLTPAAAASVAGESSSVVRLMSRWGGVLSAPYDLRQSFARHLAQNALVTRLKRYAIDRVYRERRVLGFHPRELYECAFDIVTPSSAPATLAAAEAELLFAARQIVGTRPGTCFIRLNHLCLVRAVLLHCGIDYSSHEKVCSLLAKTKLQEGGNSSRASAESALIGSDLAEQTVAMLLSLLTKEDSYERLSAWLRPLVQKKAKLVCQQGLLQLKQLIEYIGLLGVEWSVVVSLGLIYDLRDYSGVVFQVVWDQRGKHGRTERCVIAAGGRYDSMIHKLRQSLELGVPPDGTQQHAAGISLSLDKLVSVLSSAESGQKSAARRTVDVIVCAVGSTGESCSQRLKVLRELWASGISCSSIDEAENNNDDIQSVCFEMGASYVVYLKDGGCRIRNLSKDIARDKSQQDGWLSQSELVENLQRMMRTSPSSSNLTCSLRDSQMKAESRSLSEPSQPPVNVHFDVIDKMVNAAARRRLEIQVLNSVNGVLQKLSGRARVEILVLSLESEAVRLLASSVNVDRAQLDPSSVIKRFPRHKKYLERISERVQELTNTVRRNSAPVLVFYSIIDNSFQTVL